MQGECSDHACEGIAEPKSWDACIPIVNKTLWIKSGHADKYNENMFKSVQNECCDKTLAFWHDRVQPRTLKASTCSLATWKWP